MLRDVLKRKKKSAHSDQKASTSHWSEGLYASSEAMPLEPRIMLDGAGLASAVDALSHELAAAPEHAVVDSTNHSEDEYSSAAHNLSEPKRNEVVIVDATVEGYQQLLTDLIGEVDQLYWQTGDNEFNAIIAEQNDRLVSIYAISEQQSGMESVSNILASHNDIDAVHILSHGTEQGIVFNDVLIDIEALESNVRQVSAWGDSLTDSGDILLYGCETGVAGAEVGFVQTLSELTDADVAASNDLTGHADAGGDWDLEVRTGNIETDLVPRVEAQAAFAGVLSADAATTLDIPANGFINENFEFCLIVDNVGTDPGYAPYVNLFIEPGVEINDASLLGSSLSTSEYTWDAVSGSWLNSANNPITDHPVNPAIALPPGPAVDGTVWTVIELPFGSFVPSQPPAKILFDASIDPSQGAILGQPVGISAQTGFQFGEDPYNNPVSDPPLLGPLDSSTIVPTVIEVDKESYNSGDNPVGMESEQGTGPNNPITFEITVDIADGQTVDNILLSDVVPTNVHYLGSLTVAGSGAQVNLGTSDATIGVHNSNQLRVSFDSVTGTIAEDDIVITYQGYIPDVDVNGDPIVDPITGVAPDLVENTVQVDGEFSSIPVSDADTDEVIPASLAIQKSVDILDNTGSPAGRDTILPGDLLEWTLKYQISDYLSLENFEISDNYSDGQLYVSGSETVEIFENSNTTGPSTIAPANVTLGSIDPATGLTEVRYDMSSVIAAEIPGSGGVLDGDLVDGTQSGKTWVHVKFRTEVQETFQYPGLFGGDPSVDVGDILSNDVAITAEVEGTGNVVSNSSSESVSVDTPVASKSVYAINLDTDGWDTSDPEIAPGQSITYRITIELPTTDVENLVVTDYLPLPIFEAASSYAYTGLYSGVDNVPAPGEYGFGPLTDVADFPPGFFNTTGTALDIAAVSVDNSANSVTWDFDAFDQTNSAGGVIDLLFTTATANVPFDDGLSITNQAQISYDNTNNPQEPVASIVQVEPLAPMLEMTKGVVAVDSGSAGTFSPGAVGPVAFNDAGTAGPAFAGTVTSPGIDATPIDSDVSELDAGDIVRFAITIENTGGFVATDITVNDAFPSQLSIPAGGLNMTAALGDGTPLTVVGNLFTAGGVADPAGVSFQQGGAEAVVGKGREDSAPVTDGSNILVLTYDLVVDDSAIPLETFENSAELLTFAALDGGVDYTDGNTNSDWSDVASVSTVTPAIEKDIVSSGIVDATNPLNRAVAGEYITYSVTVTLPEGTVPAAQLRDRIDSDTQFDQLISITPSSADITTDLPGGFAAVVAPPSGTENNVYLDLGNIVNTNTDNWVAETLTFVYRVYVKGDVADNTHLRNRAYFRWDTDGNNRTDYNGLQARAPVMRVITPDLEVDKAIVGIPPTDVGDPISYEITVQHTAASDTTAYNVSFSDTLPVEIGAASIDSVVDESGAPVAGFTLAGNTITNADFTLGLTETVTITVSGTVTTATAGAEIINTANIDWTTLDPTVPDDGLDAIEPTFTDDDSASFVVNPPVLEKSIISTGINTPGNDNTEAVNGEYVMYRLLVTVPEGTTPTAEIIDALPANVTYDPSFTPTIVLSSPDLSMTNSGVPPTVTAAGLSFDFGTITNSNNSNPTPETITIEYRAYVEGAAATDTPTNVADFIWDIDNDGVNTGPDDGSQTDSSVLDILEPELEVVKSVSPATADAGDTVQYTMVIQHTAASDTDAYDASFNDVLPVELVSPSIVSAVDSGGATVPGFTLSGNTIANVDYDLPLGETITLTVTGVVDTAASASTTVSNTASIDWDTLGDDTQGNQAVEGVGAASDDADFTIASPLFNKSIVSSGIDNSDNALAEVVAGEFVTYELEVIVPEGTTPLASITDTLDPDLLFDPSFTITAVASADVVFTGSATVPSFSGSDVIFDLGTVTNSNTDNSIDDTITITYSVYADSDVVLADSLPNSAELAWDSDNDGAVGASDDALTDTTSVTVIAPELQVEKTITTMPADAGDTVVYRYEISHTAASNAAALDASFSDLLPVGIDAVSVTAVDGGGAPVTGFVIVPGSPQDTISNPDYDLPEGESIVVTVTGTLNTSVSASSTVTNVANIDWDTLGDDSEGNQSAEATGNDSDSASFIVASPSFSKGLASTGIDDSSNASNEVVAGEFVTYSLEVVVPEGTTPMASITDTLDPDLILDPSFVITAVPSSGVSFTGSATAPVVSGSDVTFDIGTITNTNTDNTSDDTITITYRVYADSDVVLADNLPNSAEFVWDADNDGDLDAADGLLTDTANVTVISPELQVEKTLTTVPTDAGDTVVYRYEISHTAASNAAALDASFSDLLPAGIDAVGVTAVDGSGAPVTGFVIVPGSPQDTISNPDYDLPEGESIIVTVTGILNTSVSASTTVTNTANIDWDSLGDDSEGVQAAETTGSDSDSASFIVASPTFEKSIFSTGINANGNDNQEVVAGEYVEYRLEVVVPEGTTPMAQITDTLHADLLFDNSYTITAVGSSGVSFTGPATTPTVSGSDVTFDLGTITNTNTDDTVDDTVTILYRVYADSDVVSGATLNNDATLIWDADNDGDNNDNDGVLNDTVDVTVISPELLVDKSVSLMPSDVGDSLEYTIVIRHTDATDAPLPVSGTSAHDVTFSDVLPPGVANPAIVSAVDSTGGAVAGFVLTGNTISHAGFDLLHNDTVTLTISGEADASIVEGDLIDNIADITWSTLDDGANDGYDAGESGGSDSDNATFSLGNIEKTILNTGINDASNDNGEVVTGEYVTYQLSVEIPQGTSALAEIEDTLDTGLVFDQANGVTVVPSSTNLSTTIAPGDFSSVTSSYDATGNVISIDLGDITNTAPAGTVETLTITYRVYVDNDMVNAGIGATLNNAVDFKWDIDGDGSNDGPLDGTTEAVAPDVEVIGPELQITKDVITVPSDAGDVVTYEMVISHTAASQAAAFDATFTDTLPSEISGVSIVSAVDSGGAAVPGFTVSGNTVSHADYDLPLGETITLTVTGTVNTTASASTTVDNVATIDWDTLGDDGQGNQSVEDGGSANDNDSFVVASPTFEKLIAGTGISDATNDDTEVVAGEYISYDLVVTVPEGTTPMAQITDTLHSNLIFDATYSVTAAGSAGVSFTGPATSPTVSGSDVTFDLGTITNTNTDDTVADTVTITYRAYADSDVARGDTLNNDATLIWDADNDGDNNDGDGVLDDTTDVNVITPSMQVDKSVTLMPSDIGDLIEYTMVIRHTDAGDAPADPSDTGAYDVTFTDVLPAGLINPSVVSAVDSSGTSVAGFGVSGNTVNHAGLDMPLGEFITLTVQAEAGAAIVEGDLVDNIADITWTTLDDDANDGFDAGESGGSDSDNATFSLGNIEKSILNTGINDASNDNGEVVTGEYVTYQLSVEIPQGTSALAEIEDTLDTGLVFDQANGVTVVPSSTNLSTTIAPGDFSSVTSSYDATGNVISIDLGDITNTAPAGTVETLTITYRVYVDNDMVNAGIGATLNNAVDFKWDIDGDGSNDGPLDGTTEAVAPDVEVIGPELQITKDITTVPSDAGDVVTYEMVISHTAASQAAAFDATFTDTLPSEISGVSIVSAVDSGGAAVPGFTVSGNTVSHADYDLPLGETITLTVTGTVNTTASASTTVDNVATIDWDTLGDDGQGNQSVEDGGSANDNDSFVVASPTFEKLIAGTGISDATNDDTEVVAGEYITYDLVVTVPEGTTPMAQITDTLHSNLIFDATYSVTAAGSAGVSFTGPATSPTVSGSDVTFDLGTITNTNTDDTVADTVTITYRAYADSDVARGDTLNNDATLIWDADNDGDNNDGDGVLDDTTDVNVITPSMQVDKSVTLMPSDIGDLIEYTMVIRHTDAGDAPADPSDTGAYDVTFTDVLPAGLINPSVVSAVDSSGTSVAGFGVSGNTVNHAGVDIPLGEFITLTVQAEAGAAIVEGDLVDNIADITWTTLDDDANDGFDAGESGGSDSDNATFSLGNIEKSILNTGISDASNDNAEVVTGEYVTYQLSVEIPQGTSALAEIEDTLDTGLVFDQANGVTVVPSSTNLSTSIAPGDFSSITSSYDATGNVISIDLGDITNTAPAGTVETLTITYRVYVDNDMVNAGIGATLNNAVDFKWDINGDGSNDGPLDGTTEAVAPEVEVIGPELQITKDITTVPSDAGDVVTYEMVISHTAASQAAAFDATFTDTLPSEISGVSIVSAVDSSGTAVPGFTVSGNTVSHADYDLPLGETITLTITGTVNTTASASTTVNNIASIDWDTLGDDSQGNQSVEDGGSASDNDSFVVASPTFEKSIFSTGINANGNDNQEVVAGEYIEYQLAVVVPEGTTPMAQITDTLHADLLFDSSYTITAVGSSGVSFTGPATMPTVTGSDVTFDLGTITNTNTDDTVDDTVAILYRVYADSDVVLGATLNNDATLIWDADNDGDNNDNDGVLNDSVDVSVIAPQLLIDKTVSLVPSDIGDPLEYTIVVRHTDAADTPLPVSGASAYDVTFSDVLPAGITNPAIVSAVDGLGAPVSGFTLSGNTVSHTGFDLLHNDTVTLTISGEADASIVEGDLVDNIADITWSTLDDDANDGFDASESGGSDSDNATFSLGNIEKSILNTGINDASNDNAEVVTGEYVTYQLAVEIPQGTSALAEIEDTLDAGLVFDQANGVTVVPSSTNLSTTIAPGDFSGITSSYDAVGNVISIDLGDITNTAPAGTVETLTITYRVYVDNDMVNAGIGATLNNAVDFKWDINGDGSNDGPLDGTTEAVAPDVEVIGPELQITKDITTVPSDAGDVVTYEMVISHTAASQAAAFDATFTDTLPSEISGVSIVSAVDSGGAAVPGFTVSGNTVSHADYDLPLGETITLTVTGTVNTTASASTTVDNVATIDWDTLGDDSQGNQSVEDGGSANDNDSFVVASPTFDKLIAGTGISDATNDDTEVVAGEYISYDLVVTVPEGTTPMAQITDTLHSNLIFDSGYSIAATGSAGVSFTGPATSPTVSGSNVTFDLGTITNTNTDDAVPDTVTITYRVYADSDVARGDTLNNDATLIWDADNDGDNNDGDGVLNDTTDVNVITPSMQVDKSVTLMPSDIGDLIEYTMVIRHTDAGDAPADPSDTGAYDVTFTDVLPAGLINPSVVSAVDSSGTSVAGFGVSGNTVSHTGVDIPLGEFITLTVQAEAGAAIVEGDLVDNIADITWTTLDDDANDGFDAGESGGSDSDNATFSLGNIEKSILNTGISDASNDNAEVVTGEYVTYQLSVEIPQGTSALAEIEDTLDTGLVFDQANGVTVVPSSTNLSTTIAPGDFSSVTSSYDATGNVISIDLGDITNTAPAGTVETLTITYRVYVDNDMVNAGIGATLNNAVDFKWDIDGDGSNDGPLDGTTEAVAPDVEVIGPELQITKDVITVPSDAGDVVTYEMVISHTAASQAAAFDATFTDTLPSEISGVSIVSAVDSGGAAVPGFTVSGNTVSHADYDLPLGETITLTVTGTVNTTASASTTVDNVATIDWDTLGDDGQGNQSVEDGGSANDNDSFVVASPTFEKSIFSTGINANGNDNQEVVAGEYIEYRLAVVVPEGTTPMAQITDTLHADLLFDSSYTITAVGSSGVSFTGPATMPTVTGSDVTFDLGTITNTNTDDTVDDTVAILYRVYADSDVVLGATLNNDATLIWDADNDGDNNDNDGVLNDSVDVSVIAPQLVVDKQVSAIPSDIGDPVEYTIVIRHSDMSDAPLAPSGGSAFDVTFNDVLPAGITNVSIVSAVDSSGANVPGFTLSGNTVSHIGFDLDFNDMVVLTVSGVADSSLPEGDTIVNSAQVSWSTLDDESDDGIDSAESGGNGADEATFSLSDIEKSIVATGINDASNDDAEVVSGEYITYQLAVEVPHGLSALAEIEDTLDAGLIFDQAYGVNVVPSSANLRSSLPPGDFSATATSYDTASNIVSFNLGDINNSAAPGSIETLTLTYRVFVDNNAVTASTGSALNNAVDFKWDINGDGSNDGPLDGTTESAAPEVIVIEPILEVSKQVIVAPVDAGDLVTYEMVIQHTDASSAGAFDASFSDTLPSEISNIVIDAVTDSAGSTVPGFSVTGNTVSNSDFDLAVGDTITLTVSGTLNTTASASTTVNNVADISWQTLGDSTQGKEAYENSGSDAANDEFTLASPQFEKRILDTGINDAGNGDTQVVAGEYVTYQLVVTVPEGTTPMVQVNDLLDPDLQFDPSFSITAETSPGVSITGPATTPVVGGNNVMFDLGTVTNLNTDNSVAENVTITYRVYADADTVTDAVLPNEATLIWDANNDGQNNTADDGVLTDDSLVTVVSPRLLVEKSVTQVPAEIGDPISYTFVIRHTEPADAPLQVSQTGAYDVSFNDDLPDGLINLSIDSATFSDGTVLSGFQLSGNTLSHPSFDLAFGDTVTVVVSGVIGPDMIEGDTIRNDAEISWTTLDASADDGFDTGEAMGYQSDSATFTLSDLSKTIVSTGITDAVNDDAAAVVGEFIDYQVVVEVPKGFSPQAEVFDILDPGLVFDEGQGVSAVVSSGNVVTTLAQSDFTGLNAVYDPLANTISVALGDIQNNAPVGVVENITLNYRVYVANDSAVASTGTLLNNAVSFRWDIDGDGSNAGPNDGITRATADEIVVISPELLLDKSIVTVPGETGDEIVYQFQISHDASSTANAYNVTLSDAIPAGVSDLVILSATDAANMPVTGFTLSGNTLMYSGFNLTLGNTVTVTVSGVVNSSVDSGDTIDNTAAITWSSLDANNPADGADIIDPGLESVQTQDDSDQFSIADLHKSIISTGIDCDPNDNTHGVVGEFITYQLIVDVPQGNIAQAEIADTLDEGLVFDSLISVSSSSGLLSNDAGSDFSTVSSPQQGDTGRLVFSLGNVSNTDQDNDTTETLTLVYRVYVENSEAVSIGTALNNDAVLRWDIDGDGVADDVTTDQAPPVTVLQPVISVSKTSDDAMPHLGQVINYTVTVMNEPAEYGADAHDVSVVDVLPQNALFDPASVQINGIAVADVSNVTDLSSGNTLALSIDSVAYNTEVTISYQALLTDDTEAYGSTVDNTVSVEWTTLSDQDPQDGADNAERNSSDGLAANAGNSITLTAPDYRIEKSSSVSSSLSAGDSISYTLNVSNIGTHEGTGVVVTDQFPVQVLGEPESISSGGSFNPDTGLVTWLIPTLGIDEQVVLTVDASVSDPQSADTDGDLETADDSFTNVASVTDDGLHGGDPNQTDNTSQATNEVVAAPDYTIRKTNDITMAAPTQLITYTITANNVGTQAGTNVEVVDEFPVDILAIENADGGIVDQEAGTITWSIPLFTVGQIESFSVDAVVLPTANLDTADQLFTNTVSITDDGLNGMDPTPDNNQAAESDMLRAGAGEPLFLTALPEQSGQSEIISNVLRGTPTFYSSAASDNPNTARILTSEHLNGEDSDKRKIRTGENDLLNGGSLLDTFNTPPPPIDCDPGVVTYDYESDPDSLEFLEWLSPEELQEQGVELEEAATSDSEPEAIGQVRQDDVTGVVKELKPAQTLQQQIERESANLHSAGKQEILEAFKDAV